MPGPDKPISVRYDDKAHKYWIDGVEVPSVSTILDATLPKPALTWWGFRVGMAAVAEFCKLGKVSWPTLCSLDFDEIKNNTLIQSLLAPDVEIDGKMALSLGIKIKAVKATFPTPAE